MIETIFYLLFFLVWAGVLWILGKRGMTGLFFALLYAPLVISGVLVFMTYGMIFAISNLYVLLVCIALLAERIIWGFMAKEAAGEDKLVWFIVILIFPIIGWLLYAATNAR